jgi:uncharacterized membrane protein
MNSKELRAKARESLKGNWGVAVLASIIATVFGATGSSISNGNTDDIDFSALSQLAPSEVLTTLAVFGAFIIFGLIVSLVISAIVSIGYAQFNIDLIDGVKPNIGTLFSKSKQVTTAIVSNLLVFVHVAIGTILFIVPGIIAALNFSMVNYIIAENPGITAREALKKSKEMMQGNKIRFLCLGLSFFGWAIITALTLGIAGIWVAPYMQASFAAFYREVA